MILNLNPTFYWLLFFIIILIGIVIISMKLYKKNNKENSFKKKVLFAIPTIFYCFIVIILFFMISGSKLNYIEEQVYDRITSMVNEDGFFNPKEARLLDVIVYYKYSESDRKYIDTIDRFYVKILGTNKVGGTINKCYRIYYNDYKNSWDNSDEDCEDIYKSGLGYEQLSTKSIKKVNNEIKKYWDNLGL